MRAHGKPSFAYSFDVQEQINNLEAHRKSTGREIPRRKSTNLLIASWNLTNFGLQKRQKRHLKLMAEVIRPFDVVAFQEVADNLKQFHDLLKELGQDWNYICTDIAGNAERLGYLYRIDRVESTGLAAELAMRGYERAKIQIEGIDAEDEPFTGFNRNPYMASFKARSFEFSLVNVHLYWSNMSLRRLETRALAKWAKSRIRKPGVPNNDIILLGDFNMPSFAPDDEIYRELKRYGLQLPKHTTDLIGSNLAGDAHYDEVAFFPGRTKQDFTGKMGVFDFDNALFKDLWSESQGGDKTRFFKYIRYYMADHRPIWAEFRTSG